MIKIKTLIVVINQYLENQTVFPHKRFVPGTNSYSETFANFQITSCNIKVFSDSIPKANELSK